MSSSVTKLENQPYRIFFVLPSLAFLDFHPMLDTARGKKGNTTRTMNSYFKCALH